MGYPGGGGRAPAATMVERASDVLTMGDRAFGGGGGAQETSREGPLCGTVPAGRWDERVSWLMG